MSEGVTKTPDIALVQAMPLAGALGAEIRNLGAAQLTTLPKSLNAAFLDHKVLALRGQSLEPASLLAFSKLWGDVHFYPYMMGLKVRPEVSEIVTVPDARRVFGNRWHTDQMYDPRPVKATLLYARDLPPFGGDTIFTDLEKAYEALSDGMKAMLSGLHIHCDPDDRTRYGGKSRAE